MAYKECLRVLIFSCLVKIRLCMTEKSKIIQRKCPEIKAWDENARKTSFFYKEARGMPEESKNFKHFFTLFF